LRGIAAVVNEHGALSIVDAVSSVGAIPLLVDEWGLDFVLSGSQKAWMCPPGLMIAAVGPRAWDAYAASRFPRFFWDIGSAKTFAEQGMTPATPALSLLYALDAALDLILEEGIEAVWARHAALAQRTRYGLKELGLSVFGDDRYASSTVTAVSVPAGTTAKEILRVMKAEHDVELQGGQGQIADSTFRIGHMGWVSETDIDGVLTGLKQTLSMLSAERAASAVERG
jgi:aspartate aminotransferase-like enzyme